VVAVLSCVVEQEIVVMIAEEGARMAGWRRRSRLLLALACGAGLIWGGWAWWTDRRYQSALDEIESEIKAGRYGLACRDLQRLLSWKADPNGGIVYFLGSCELARGRTQAASEAWERVVPGSAFSEKAIRGRMQLFQQTGQLAAVERLINEAAEDRRNDRTALLVLLVPLYSQQGRIEEALRLLETRWEHLYEIGEGALDPAIGLLRTHIELTLKSTPLETIRTSLDQAAQLAPDDDRVWLGRANLAIRAAAYDEAERWLDACLRQRSEDLPVWRARLNWGIATNRIDAVQQAVKHIPATALHSLQIRRANAWLAARRGDVAIERVELQLLHEIDPSDRTALERLARLAEKDGRAVEAAELLHEEEEIDRIQARYVKLHERGQPIRGAVEMARLAERLGRRFEARAFLILAISEDPDREDLRRDLKRVDSDPERSPSLNEHRRA
jgi:tetratricopeptide (TPR) repeat protein